MAPFYGWNSFALRLQHLRGGSLLLTIQFPVISGAHFINLKRIKGAESTLEPPNGFEHGTPGLGTQRLKHYATAPSTCQLLVYNIFCF